jgi:shikimate 5-dehydrogenase
MSGRRSLVDLIGAKIMSSLSPAPHEDAFAAAGIRGHDYQIDLDPLPGRRLEHLLAAVKAAGFETVAFPCKQAVMPLLNEISADAQQIGAVNSITIANDDRTVGYNTNRTGLRRSFEGALGRACVEGNVIYTPIEKQLIKTARAVGARVLTGGGMCVHQAAETFRLFTGTQLDVKRIARSRRRLPRAIPRRPEFSRRHGRSKP